MRAVAWFAVVVCGAGLASAGCDWRDFDKIQDQAPVLSVGTPDGYAAPKDFGGVVLGLAPPADGSLAARFLGAATVQTGLALVQLDAAGKASSQNVTSTVLDNLGNDPLTAMAEIPGLGKALLGAPSPFGGALLTLDLTTLVVTQIVVSVTEPQFGVGVAAGNLGGGAAADLVATSGSVVHVYVDGSSPGLMAADSAACPITLSTSLPSDQRINRAVVIGTLTGSGPQVVVGTPVVSGGGSVSFFTVDATAGTVTCAMALTAPAATDARFGQALAIGDFDGDGISDLLVGAPPNHAYLYKGPIAAGAAPSATITDSSTGGAFGAALIAFNLDGKTGDEAFIADPEATVGGQAHAGNVFIYSGAALATKSAVVLADHAPGGDERYGSALGALPFCATQPCPASLPRLPIVGASSQIFTYFTLGPTDPRK